jgi:hypothetical protein
MPGENDCKGLAYHEAGHAVVAWALGLRVIGISLGTKGDGGLNTLLDEAYPPSLFQALVINRGAAAAEDLFAAPTRSLAGVRDRSRQSTKSSHASSGRSRGQWRRHTSVRANSCNFTAIEPSG